jgi:GMP synthase-like glutamine amidotransferase
MLATALGGTVSAMPKPELGWIQVQNVSVDKEDAMLTGLPWTQTYFSWHQEIVSTLPEGATVLQRNAACPVQAYRVGPWSYGFQYHPEWNRQTILKEIGEATEQELAAAGTTAEIMRQGTNDHYATAERMAGKIFELCNLMLFPSSRLQSGLAARSPLHH